MIALLLLLVQADAWSATPARPTVGDTIWLERTITAPPGWRVRVGKLEPYSDIAQLGDPLILAAPNGWTIRYPVVAWIAGSGTFDMPSLWRLGPDGSTDSLAGGTVTLQVSSIIPDSVRSPQPQPALGPLRPGRPNLIPALLAALLAGSVLLALLGWRRRAPREVTGGPGLALDAEVADQRWLAAGEPKAVAARAAQRLRGAIARAIPGAHEALSTTECLASIEQAWPNAPLRELRELLHALDQVAFAAAHGGDVGPLAARAHALAREFGGNGASRKEMPA